MTHDSNQSFDPDKHKYMYRSIAGTIIPKPCSSICHIRRYRIVYVIVYVILKHVYILLHSTFFSIRYMICIDISYSMVNTCRCHKVYIWKKQQPKQIDQPKPTVIYESFFSKILRFVAKQRSRLLGNATSSSSPLILVILPTFPFSSGRFTTAVSFTVCPTSQPR